MPLDKVLAGIGTALAPIGGSIGSAMLQQHYALKNWRLANEYNSPKNQVARNKEAGLPLAAMFSGGAGSQSQTPSTPNVDPSLGVARGMEQQFMLSMQRKQKELLDAQIYTEKGRGQREWVNAFRDTIARDREHQLFQYDSKIGENDLNPLGQQSNLIQGIVRERKLKDAELYSKTVANNLQDIEYKVKDDLFKSGKISERNYEELQRIILDNELIRKHIEEKENQLKFARAVIKHIEESPSGITAWKAILLNLAKGVFGGVR